jgi:type II secretory pathway pseudopilin PulG
MELCVVVAIIGIIAAFAIPGLIGMRGRYQLRSATTDVLSALKKARTEAVKRNSPVAVEFKTSSPYTYTIFVDDGSGAGGVAADKIINGTEKILSTSTLPSGLSFGSVLFYNFPDYVTEFNSGGLALFKVFGTDTTCAGSLKILGKASLKVDYMIVVTYAGAVTLKTITH